MKNPFPGLEIVLGTQRLVSNFSRVLAKYCSTMRHFGILSYKNQNMFACMQSHKTQTPSKINLPL